MATEYHEGRRRGDETRIQVFSSWPPGALRRGIDVYTTLTTERG